jgi:BirA family biotin operon repressor/biotin-[acetyl-CoA-carboxylase] ligase
LLKRRVFKTPYNLNMLFFADSQTLLQQAQGLSQATQMPVQLAASIDSSNTALLNSAADLPLHPQPPCALVALEQTAGRGRRGREWLSHALASNAPAPAFLATLGVRSHFLLPSLGLLPLHMGVAVAQQLQAWGCPAQLKWPNDLVIQTPQGSAKLGGILVETRSVDATSAVIMGMGMNWHSAPALPDRLTTFAAQYVNSAPDSLAVCAALLNAMHTGWQRTVAQIPCDFGRFDALYGLNVQARDFQGNEIFGVAKGIDAAGHLGLQTTAGMHWLHSGEVSVRAQ